MEKNRIRALQLGDTTRMSYSKINEVLEMPNLIGVQKNSYQWFLDKGLKEVFEDISPITDFSGNLNLDLNGWNIYGGTEKSRLYRVNGYSMNVCDSGETKGVIYVRADSANAAQGLGFWVQNGTLNLYNVIIDARAVTAANGTSSGAVGAAICLDSASARVNIVGGTIYGGMVAANGTLALTNVTVSGFNLSDALPLTLDGLGDTANLRTWSVVIDGTPSKYKVVCSNGQLALVPPGVTIIFR